MTAGINRDVIALDPATGVEKWRWTLDEGERTARAPRRNSGRGVTYWRDGDDARIVVVTPGFRLVSLDARTGRPVPSFGATAWSISSAASAAATSIRWRRSAAARRWSSPTA